MTAAFMRCRGDWVGGAPMMPPPPPSTRPRTWVSALAAGVPLGDCCVTDTGVIVCGSLNNGTVYRSTDNGETFETIAAPFAYPSAPAFGNGRILLGGLLFSTVYASDDDGETYFKAGSIAAGNDFRQFMYGNGTWVGAEENGNSDTSSFQYSTDGGAVWSACGATGVDADYYSQTLSFDGSVFLACGHTAAPYIATSATGIDWVAHAQTNGFDIAYMACGYGKYVASDSSNGYLIVDSLDALLSTAPSLLPDPPDYSATSNICGMAVLPNGTVILFLGYGNIAFTVDDGATWTWDTPAWLYEPNGDGTCSWHQAAVTSGGNITATMENTKYLIGVRGVNC